MKSLLDETRKKVNVSKNVDDHVQAPPLFFRIFDKNIQNIRRPFLCSGSTEIQALL